MVPINHVVSYDGQIVGVNCQSPTHTNRGAVLQWPCMRASIWLLLGLCSFQRQNYPICNPPWTHSGYFHWLISDHSVVNWKWTQKCMLTLYWVPCTLGFSQEDLYLHGAVLPSPLTGVTCLTGYSAAWVQRSELKGWTSLSLPISLNIPPPRFIVLVYLLF